MPLYHDEDQAMLADTASGFMAEEGNIAKQLRHWRDRDCQQITDDLAAAGRWSPLEVSDAEPYLPDSPSDLAAYGVHYVAARVG